MKNNYILGFIIEGTDGVGKTTLRNKLTKYYNYSYFVYDRGDISNYVYSKIYNRDFIPMQLHLPILYILLTCSKEELKKRIINRDFENKEILEKELNKIEQQDNFINAYNELKNDYNIITINTTNKNEDEVLDLVVKEIEKYIYNLPSDEEISEWNKLYKKGCEKLKLKFEVKNKQSFINNFPICTDYTCYNGAYETFKYNKTPISLI